MVALGFLIFRMPLLGMPVYEIGLGTALYRRNFNSDLDDSVFIGGLATIKRINW